MEYIVKAPDGTPHRAYERALAEARWPTHNANVGTTPLTVRPSW